MLILADYLIYSKGEYEIYHGDFPVVINSDDLSTLFISSGRYANRYEDYKYIDFFFIVGKAKNGSLYRLSDIFTYPDKKFQDKGFTNPRVKAHEALNHLLDAVDSGKQLYRSVFNLGGTDVEIWANIKNKARTCDDNLS